MIRLHREPVTPEDAAALARWLRAVTNDTVTAPAGLGARQLRASERQFPAHKGGAAWHVVAFPLPDHEQTRHPTSRRLHPYV